MVRYKIHYKSPPSPFERTSRLILVPVIAALLAIGGLFTACNPDKEPAWNSPRTVPTEAPLLPKPVLRTHLESTTPAPRTTPATAPEIPAAGSASAGRAPATTTPPLRIPSRTTTTATSTGSAGSESRSDLREQGNFSPRTATVPESIQLTPCQRSTAACFASGGLDTLMDNLDGLAIDPITGRFCFSFQEGCRR